MQVMDLLLSLLTVKLVSVVKVCILKIFMVLPQPHHSLPELGTILDTGVFRDPTVYVVGQLMFQPPPKIIQET